MYELILTCLILGMLLLVLINCYRINNLRKDILTLTKMLVTFSKLNLSLTELNEELVSKEKE
ncbi:MAG: hypothetical protein ACOC56_00330 [Atribacterota bacterium]